MTSVVPVRRPVLRATLGVLVVVDLISFFIFIGAARDAALASGLAINPFTVLLSRALPRALVIAIGAASAIAFARRPGRLWEGVVALGALTLLSTVHAQLFGSAWRHLYYSGACLAGWLLGLAVSRRSGAPEDESYARVGAIALLSAAYCNAAISKLVYGGVDWLSGAPIQAIIVAQDGLVGDGIGSLYRSWVVGVPAIASFFSLATMAFELGAPLMLLGGWIRIAFALGLFAMHANIYLLTPILYWESMVLLLAFGLSADGRHDDTAPAAAGRRGQRLFAAAAVLLAVWALLAVRHQANRYAARQAAKAAALASPVPAAPTVRALRQIGPFAVGDALADTWALESLGTTDGGFTALFSGPPGRVSFEITCAASEHRSPFDIDGAHIFYSSSLDFSQLEALGSAVRERVQTAAGGEICRRVAAWRAAAQ